MNDYANKKWLRTNQARKRNALLMIVAIITVLFFMSLTAKGAFVETDETLALFSAFSDDTQLRALETLVLKTNIEDVAEQHGSGDSERFARAVLNTRYPRLITGIGVAEKGGFDPGGRRGARGEKGFSQIYESQWGAVGSTIEEQVKKTEEILTILLAEANGSEEVALRMYNAGLRWECKAAGRYAQTVLAVADSL